MKERVVQFGDSKRLVGIVTQPKSAPDPARPGILLLNAGIIHRVGAHRLNVKLARFLAAAGYTTLRFDLSGIGDSRPSRSGAGYEMQAVHDIQAALDCLQGESTCQRAISVGICSGADNGYAAAIHDERISGIVMLDPYAYSTTEARIRFHLARLMQTYRWRRAAARRLRLLRDSLLPRAASAPPRKSIVNDYVRTPPPREEYGRNLSKLARRGTKMYMAYSKGMFGFINSPSQFFRVFREFGLEKNVRVELLHETDHTFTELREQEALAKRLLAWIESEFGSVGAHPGGRTA